MRGCARRKSAFRTARRNSRGRWPAAAAGGRWWSATTGRCCGPWRCCTGSGSWRDAPLSLVPVGGAARSPWPGRSACPRARSRRRAPCSTGPSGGWTCWSTTATGWCSGALRIPPRRRRRRRRRRAGAAGVERVPLAGTDPGPRPARPRPPRRGRTGCGSRRTGCCWPTWTSRWRRCRCARRAGGPGGGRRSGRRGGAPPAGAGARTVTVSGADFRYRADAAVTGPVHAAPGRWTGPGGYAAGTVALRCGAVGRGAGLWREPGFLLRRAGNSPVCELLCREEYMSALASSAPLRTSADAGEPRPRAGHR